jgi:hypothetical protein
MSTPTDTTARRLADLAALWPKVPAHHQLHVAREVERVYLLVHQLGTRPTLDPEDGC